MWEGVGDWTELQHFDPHSFGHNSVSFPFSWGPSLSGTWSSFQHLLSNCNYSIEGLRAPSAGCWFSPPYLYSNCLDLQLIWLSVHRVIKLFDVHSSSCERHNFALNSTRPRSRLYPNIPRLDAPVIYTGTFPILTVWPGRRSIYNIINHYYSSVKLKVHVTITHSPTLIYIYIYIYTFGGITVSKID